MSMCFCTDLLIENQYDHNYSNLTFTNAVSKGKLINASPAILFTRIVQHSKIVVQKKKFHKNVDYLHIIIL